MTFAAVGHRVAFKGGTLLLRRRLWRPAAFLLGRAIRMAPDHWEAQNNLAIALLKLERWEDAARAAEQAARLNPSAAESRDLLGIALLQLERWEEAAEVCEGALTLEEGHYATHHRLGMALLHLGRWDAAATALHRAITLASQHPAGVGEIAGMRMNLETAVVRAEQSARPSVSSNAAPSVDLEFTRREVAFWTTDNLGADVFAAERWLEDLTAIPQASQPGPRLLFVLDNDFGELTTVKYFLLGQALAGRATLLLPERLYAHNREAIPGRTRRYGSVADVLQAVDREQPAIVFLCSGYLICEHLAIAPEELAHLVDGLRERGCCVVTTDPYVGELSQHDPRTLISFQLPREQALKWVAEKYGADRARTPEIVDLMAQSRRTAEEQAWAYLGQSERVLRDTYHLYPSYCDAADQRNFSFFNDRLLRPAGATSGTRTPHWLFILASTDYDLQGVFEGIGGFAAVVANKLLETRAAGRHPILIGPRELIDQVVSRLPSTEGIDLLSHCPFTRFMSLLLSAEHAFYWNAVSHSLLIRLFNGLPIVLFDRGHLIRIAPAVHRHIIAWYYQGWEPPLRSHHDPLTLESVEGWAADYRRQADQLLARYRRAPSPEQMIADLMSRASVPAPTASVAHHSTRSERSTPE